MNKETKLHDLICPVCRERLMRIHDDSGVLCFEQCSKCHYKRVVRD